MNRHEYILFYLGVSTGFIASGVVAYGMTITRVLLDWARLSLHLVILLLLAYVVYISLARAKRVYFGE